MKMALFALRFNELWGDVPRTSTVLLSVIGDDRFWKPKAPLNI